MAEAEPAATHSAPEDETSAEPKKHTASPPHLKADEDFHQSFAGSPFSPSKQHPEVALTWKDLMYRVQVEEIGADGKKVQAWKTLLHPMTGVARQCRTLAIMGPSGAGKTTLLNSIAGRVAINKECELQGTAYLGECVFLAQYKQLISFVAQDDIVMGKDTPREAIYFSHRMRTGSTHEESVQATEKMLSKLKIESCADTLLGVPGLIKGVSGGEKKRVNIGSELVLQPMILALDEPSTGLDSVNAYRIGKLLEALAHDDRRTVLCTIHTPSSELYNLFDDVLLLAKGQVVYHGAREEAPAYFRGLGHECPQRVNPSEFFMGLLQLEGDALAALHTAWHDHCAGAGKQNPSIVPPTTIKPSDERLDAMVKESHTPCLTELYLLFSRSWRTTWRDPAGTIGRLVQTIFFAVIMALFFANLGKDDASVQDRQGVLFMMTMNLIFLNVMSAITVFPPERSVFLMEMTNDSYSAILYYISKLVSEFPLMVALPTLYLIIVYWSMDLASGAEAFFIAWFIAFSTAYTGNAFGMFAASLFPKPEVAMALTPLMIMPMFIVGGLFANTDRLEPYWVWLNGISFPRYAYKAFIVNEFNHVQGLCPSNRTIDVWDPSTNMTVQRSVGCRFQNGDEVLRFMGFDKRSDRWGISVMALLIIMFGLRVIGAFALWIQGRGRRSQLVFEDNWKAENGGAVVSVKA